MGEGGRKRELQGEKREEMREEWRGGKGGRGDKWLPCVCTKGTSLTALEGAVLRGQGLGTLPLAQLPGSADSR